MIITQPIIIAQKPGFFHDIRVNYQNFGPIPGF